MILSRRLENVASAFQVCLIDSPPQRSQIAKTVIGAADFLVIPAEANIKGYGSLIRTLDLLASMREIRATSATVMGIIPFRDRWIGRTQTHESRLAVEGMKEEVEDANLILPSILESERYKQAINKQQSLESLGFPDLEYPFEVLVTLIKEQMKHD
ncbi:hypothetical protein NIES593_07340 [Hydrococcus rivularis NIES-593]|uniref:AAA domain-containing protein n=2 Tax=Hydrococcus TaxID=1616833 RepID=A0A1U7HLL6_9CYAN|nr:hypothetical protein NIES593_07340 [Hydrococcus rivularis NIES-593]